MPRLCKNFHPSRGVMDSPLAIRPIAHFLMKSALPSRVARFSFRTKLYMASVPWVAGRQAGWTPAKSCNKINHELVAT